MLAIRYEKGFKKSYKRVKKRGYNTALLYDVIQLLIEEKSCQNGIAIMLGSDLTEIFGNAILLPIGY